MERLYNENVKYTLTFCEHCVCKAVDVSFNFACIFFLCFSCSSEWLPPLHKKQKAKKKILFNIHLQLSMLHFLLLQALSKCFSLCSCVFQLFLGPCESFLQRYTLLGTVCTHQYPFTLPYEEQAILTSIDFSSASSSLRWRDIASECDSVSLASRVATLTDSSVFLSAAC